MRRGITAGTVLLLTLVALASPAGAARPATPEERTALTAHTVWHDECIARAEISTADPSWATVRGRWDEACGDLEGLTTLFERTARGTWAPRRESLILDEEAACEYARVPAAAGRDLGICSPGSRRRFLPCARGDAVDLRERPARCSNAFREVPFSETWIVRDVRWTRWGPRSAVGRGLAVPVRQGAPGEALRPVTLRATHLSWTCGAAEPIFTRLTIHGDRWTTRVKPFGTDEWRTVTYPAYTRSSRLFRPYRCVYD